MSPMDSIMIDHPREHKTHSFGNFTNFVRRSFRRSGRRNSSTKSLNESFSPPKDIRPMMPCRNFSIDNDIIGHRVPGLYFFIRLFERLV